MLSATLSISLLILAVSSNAFGQVPGASKPAARPSMYGGIEIDPDGIKAAVIQVSDSEQGNSYQVVFTDVYDTVLTRTVNGRLAPDVLKEASQKVLEFYTRIRQQYQVSPEHVHIIGSSDLKPENFADLVNEIKSNTGRSVTFLNLETEVRLSIVGTIPLRYREDGVWYNNRNQSILIDIGGCKIKGGYQQIRQPLAGGPYYDFVAVGIPKGTATLADEVNTTTGDTADMKKFITSAKTLVDDTVRPALLGELETKPGLEHRKKIYLDGAIVWAMMTLLHPEDRQPYIPITINDINLFYQRIVNTPKTLLNPNLLQIRDDNIRRQAEKDLKAVKSHFTVKDLTAGAEILRSLVTEYNLQEEGKKILFARFGRLSVVLSHLRVQAENGP